MSRLIKQDQVSRRLIADGGTSVGDSEQACRREAKLAADQTWMYFEQLGERLEELALVHDDEDALEAWQEVENLVTELDDALAVAQETIRDE